MCLSGSFKRMIYSMRLGGPVGRVGEEDRIIGQLNYKSFDEIVAAKPASAVATAARRPDCRKSQLHPYVAGMVPPDSAGVSAFQVSAEGSSPTRTDVPSANRTRDVARDVTAG